MNFTSPTPHEPWYRGVTRYQWMVLAIASAGWIFDVFEGQIFGACMNEALPALLRGTGLEGRRELFVNVGIGAFLVGGAVGGVVFGMLADRFGRRRIMALTILVYSLFTGLTALAQTWWQLAILRFVVGLGVGGEWAVAAAVVAEVFPARARPAASGIFHASSVLGTYLAVLAGLFIVQSGEDGWRWGFVVGIAPALLILWVRVSMKEPERWEEAKKHETPQRLGRLGDLFSNRTLTRNTLMATGLAVIGLATFWGTHFRGKDLLREAWATDETTIWKADTAKGAEMLGMFLTTTGGGLGLLAFAPLCQRIGRRGAFLLAHVAAFATVLAAFWCAGHYLALIFILPVFGFCTLAMHAGYAIYFPELFPTRLRSTGAGFCFNAARLLAAPVLLGFGGLQEAPFSLGLATAMLLLGCLFLVGLVLLVFAPETRGQPLPE